ncbi:hypothetical protein S7711_00804 [Stachybotrys chartarum IBT 7711]|uniref:C3H1-type domain-containing protein n=1 Tax=Stachybotrys chartarum (strain CBS 109288 / IBT 7711) TaxID=1280523 RepID=A0A084B088_STACB|nr:hypothetical protein S7711_00804 [Stachybotrys chartarum IBT 7711]
MLFPDEDGPLLKTWIVKRIENTSDADSDVLADYIIALLKHEGDIASIRSLCEQEIPDFLSEDPKVFLDDVFQAIKYRSYEPGAPPPPKLSQAQQPFKNERGPAASANPSATGSLMLPPQTGSRKRGFQEAADDHDGRDSSHNALLDRAPKQPRRLAGRGRMAEGRGGRRGGHSSLAHPPFPQTLPPLDPNNPLEALMQMQAMGFPYPGMPKLPQQPQWGKSSRRRGRCRDFDTKGFCSRGSTCMFDHGNESIYMPSTMTQLDEYDPADAVIMPGNTSANGHQDSAPDFSAMGAGNRRGRGGRKGRGGKRGGARAPFSADGPIHDRTKSTIVVENIPEEHFNEQEVRDLFSEFGNILDVSMQPYKHLAIVKYDDWGAANAAYRSPKAIFDNRFVKVFWYKDEGDVMPPSMPANAFGGFQADDPAADHEPEMDLAEFQRKQEEAQKQHHEREAKRLELEEQRQKLEKQQQELLEKHRQENERLQAKLKEKNGGDTNHVSATEADALRAQLAALEQEAKFLGIDPNANVDAGGYYPRGGGYRGRGQPRGRGRGRGGFVRGQAGRHAAYAQFSIDNRPRRIAITGVDFTAPEKDEILRHFLLSMGEFESVETSHSVTHVSFQDRKTAEKFYFSLHGKELQGVEGKLDLAWVKTPLPPVPVADKDSAMHEDGKDAAAPHVVSEDVGAAADDDARDHRPSSSYRQVDMDYEVADQDEWGNH